MPEGAMPIASSYTPPASCAACERRRDHAFCSIPDGPFGVFDAIKQTQLYQPDQFLFMQGEEPAGVFLICAGRVKVSTSSSEGRTLILQIAGPGDLLGITAAVGGEPHAASAEALDPCHVKFVKRADFLELTRSWGAVSFRVVQILCGSNDLANNHARLLGLAEPAAERLARFLVEWCRRDGRPSERGTHLTLALTHEEIGQLIGASRETVSRTLSRFRRERLIRGHGATLVVPDMAALEAVVHP
jgi:CRP/FNR family transcriptional regulator